MPSNASRPKISHEQDINNVVGASIFFAYIVAALALTTFLTWDLIVAHRRWNTCSPSRRGNGQNHARELDRKIKTATSLAVLSFTTLSYHMLHFLIRSHQQWTLRQEPIFSNIVTTDSVFSTMTNLRIWEWAKGSTLFEDFARVICCDPRRFWWTHLVLLYSFGWNLYMSVKGTRLQIPHLWAYLLLDQILPVSFTQNLFVVATALQVQPSSPSQNWQAPGSKTQAIITLAYLASLTAARFSVDIPYFLPNLVVSRLLLFAPFLLLRPALQARNPQQTEIVVSMWSKYRHSILALVIGGIVMQIVHTAMILPVVTPLAAVNDDPATSALSYDFLLGLFSLILCNVV
ncbi:hypothetical protein LTR84_002419 [Exophiala bonariae]|uniref:Uncharacterized protein n=1 Tax=Exophiala bonariae TaxID=1690606 RepID=A0AAV9N9P9_9EURO|nr:hypothetical protein LTR84_002419 [Exophiala bonariae]